MIATTLRRSQLRRLLQIVNLLQSGRRPNARQLAEECEVSRRTVFRDLDAIESAGILVEYDPVQQGYRIEPGATGVALGLDEAEVVAIAVAVGEGLAGDPFGLANAARTGLAKLMLALDPGRRTRVATVVDALHDGPRPSTPCVSRGDLLEAIARRVQVDVALATDEGPDARPLRVSPLRALRLDGEWSVVAQVGPGPEVRAIPLREISSIALTDEPSIAPPRFRLETWLGRR